MEALITVDQLRKRYRGQDSDAVGGISFDVAPGELFAFLGPNGAGKTTTISILTTTLAKTSGDVRIAGHDLDRDPTAVRRTIGIIFQAPSLDTHLSGEENIRLHVAIYGLYHYRPMLRSMPAEYRDRIEELARVVGLDDAIGRPVRTYSGGMKRKLEIIRSLMHRPAVLFLDEPSSGLDPVSRRGLWDYLREVRATEGTTIFLTTHYLDEAEDADRICVIDHGRIAELGTPATLKARLLTRSLLLDATDRRALRADLAAMGVEAQDDASGTLRVVLGDEHSAQDVIARLRTPLTRLRIQEPSLEEAYVRLVSGDMAATGAMGAVA